MKKLTIIAGLLFSSLAFADAAPQTAAPADVQKFIAFFDKVVDTTVADKADCTKMAADISALVDANQDIIKMANDAKAKGLQLPKDAQDHMSQKGQIMVSALMEKCGNDKGVQAAFGKMGFGQKKSSK